MKKSFFLFLTLGLITLGLSAQENPVPKTDSIVFNELIHDYGTLTQGADGNCEFVFTNKGKVPLVLNNVHASCGCTVADWPKEPIEPGKTGSIKVRYNTAIIGSFNKSITVNSNATNSTVVLRIKGNIIAKQD